MQGLRKALEEEAPFQGRITLRCSGAVLFLEPDELTCLEAAGNYLKLEVDGRTHLLRGTIQGILKRLDPQRFLRIHRSYIVNLHAVQEVKILPGGSDYAVVLRGGRELPIGRTLRKDVVERLAGR